MKMNSMIVTGCFLMAAAFAGGLHAEETTMEKAGTKVDEGVDATKSTYRKAKDEVCNMVNGKMECVAKKVGHKVQDAADSTKTKAKEIKNKVD